MFPRRREHPKGFTEDVIIKKIILRGILGPIWDPEKWMEGQNIFIVLNETKYYIK